jgi:hypothetical protein
VKELATNPLLLTLLCLEFDNSSAFPQSRSELYNRALNVLLSKWDGQRRIQRDEVYKGLSLKRKETLLGQLAIQMFDRGDYFFKEKSATQKIEEYIRNLVGTNEDLTTLEVDSLAVLKSIESQHGLLSERATGIYSFSHLTFHEYFTAKNMLDSENRGQALNHLIESIFDRRWREVFLIVVEQLDDASFFLKQMKQHIDLVAADNQQLQNFLEKAHQKSDRAELPYKKASLRAYCVYLACPLSHDSDYTANLNLALSDPHNRDFPPSFDLGIYVTLARTLDSTLDSDLAIFAGTLDIISPSALRRNLILDQSLVCADEIFSDVTEAFQMLHDMLEGQEDEDQDAQWWKNNFQPWKNGLRSAVRKLNHQAHDWEFTPEQSEKVQSYYNANLLLADCVNSECYVSREVREEIEATMLLPIASIEKWKTENYPT